MDKEIINKHRGIWDQMKQRCYNPLSTSYPDYGARGIIVCEEWKNSFNKFFEDMGPRPTDDHQIDRIDNNGNYEPNNCAWTTPAEQALNREVSKHGGVRFNASGGYWEAYMKLVYKKIHIGSYPTEHEARIARDGARKVIDKLKDRGLFALNLKELLK